MYKFRILIIIMFFLLVISMSRVNAIVNDYSLLGKIIYLDAGHGGLDSGAVSKYIVEKDMNLELVKKLEAKLVSSGAIVYLTRDGDYDLSNTVVGRKRNDLYNRAMLINNSDADIYISIHLNSDKNSSYRGMQVFYSSINKENEKFAKVMTNVLKDNLSNVRDCKKEDDYYMYSRIKKIGLLLEMGFISNSYDNYLIRDGKYQDKLVTLMVEGIRDYLNVY